jgi:hypothetical protein
MFIYGLPNANASVIAVTSTATSLYSLINTAGSSTAVFPDGITAVDLYAEDGDIRYLMDGNTPTASKGILLKRGERAHLRNKDVSKLKLIRTGSSNVAVSVAIGFAANDESDSFSNPEVGINTASTGVTGAGVEQDTILAAPYRRADSFHARFNGARSTSVQEVKAATASKKHYITDLLCPSGKAA